VSPGFGYERYRAGSRDEWTMRVGAAGAPALLFLPPLFEEMNRTRALIVAVMRRLAEAGYGCRLPDLPGTGESERALGEVSWNDWREAARGAAGDAVATISMRGGGLLDDAVRAPAWRLAPVDGASLVRDLERAGKLAGGGLAGYEASADLVEAVRAARPAATASRTVRLASDPAAGDAKLDGPALWRRSEPGMSSELSSAIACDITEWLRTCVAS
jgi:pimeloyl-ACP methyl ester carboxylesterase